MSDLSVVARNVRVRVIEAATAAALETAAQSFLAGLGEGVLLSAEYYMQTGSYSVMILYTR